MKSESSTSCAQYNDRDPTPSIHTHTHDPTFVIYIVPTLFTEVVTYTLSQMFDIYSRAIFINRARESILFIVLVMCVVYFICGLFLEDIM